MSTNQSNQSSADTIASPNDSHNGSVGRAPDFRPLATAYDLDYSDDSTSESTSESLSEPCSLDDDNNNHNTLQGQHVSLEEVEDNTCKDNNLCTFFEGVEEQKHIIISVNERLDALQAEAMEMQAKWLQMVKDIRARRRQEQEKHRLEMEEATAKIQELERLLAIAGWNVVD